MLDTTTHGLAPGLAAPEAPTSDEAGNRANGSGPRDREIRRLQSVPAAMAVQADKAFQTARARAALAGFRLHRVAIGDGSGHEFLAARWNKSVMLPDLGAVAQFLDRVGAPR